MALTSKQRAALRSAANTIDPVFQIGKGEIDDTLIQGLADCIAARELIKIKVLENSEYSAREAADTLCKIMGTVQKVLLYGGTFDPPHNGHMNNLRAALELVRPDKAIVMPAGIPPHKKASTTPGKVRLAMCQCFTALSPAVEVSDWEIAQGGRSYTVHTLEMLRDAYPGAELYLCVGSDMLLTFTQWYRWQDMLAMAALVVESREAGDEPALQAAAADLTAQGGRVLFARAEAYPCASSDIRSGKIPPEQWPEILPPETLRVVQENHLYSAEKEV